MNVAYVAGLVDGEGCIGFTKSRSNLIPRVMITNTNKDLMDLLKENFGGHILSVKKVNDTWKRAYHWCICNKKAIDFLEKIEKHLILKINQALCLYAYECIRPGKGKSWTQEAIEARDLLKSQVHWLNKKGVHSDQEPIQEVINSM